ncbi:cytochrome c oxidase accessory protein CcoG [uncultured Arcobacter sp.]|uniref:cytochrome c oxidase accessory protein CcoG n=1 Tax=uncultured Arcobacter sp. TaxID=165434 RepID=UPI0026043EC8|nr:cytochrome c oxidase accessory protein CcoG [uncultured Arcobacter sp.]
MSYSKKRYLTYLILTIFIMVTPFIKIDGNHMLLLSFVSYDFHFLGNVYNMNELFIMPFLLMFLFIGIFAMTSMFGRVWCGWACPQTIFRVVYRDLIETFLLKLRRIKNKQKDIDYSKTSNKIKKYIGLILWIILSFIIAINFMFYFVPPEDFFEYMKRPQEHLILVMFIFSIVTFLVYDIVFMKEHFCTYVCPYSRIQSVLYDNNTKQVVYNHNRGGMIYPNNEKSIFNVKQWSGNEECTTCEACVKVCPTHIDIRKGLQVECINCLECSDACSSVMGKLGKKSLIYWGSTNSVLLEKIEKFLNPKNLVYIVSLVICVLFTAYFMSEKEPFLVNINKNTELYKIDDEGRVVNNYLLTIHNSADKKYTFDMEVLNKDITIKRFKPFSLNPKEKRKTVMILATKNKLVNPKVTLLFYAKENKNIQVKREIRFFYPKK